MFRGVTVALKVAAVAGDSRFSRPEKAALGIYAKSVNQETQKPKNSYTSYRMRWKLQRSAQGLLREYRVASCNRRRKGEFVRVHRHKETGATHFDGLETCGSVWHCPICARKVTEKRRAELQAAINAWAKRGGEVYLMTLTFPHERADNLAAIVAKQAAALKLFKNSKGYKAIMREVARAGNIRALEVTWSGWHGWHPHTHDLIFAQRGALPALKRLQQLWIDAVIKAGLASRSQLNDLLEAAFDVQNGDYAADYVAKFGQEPSLQSQSVTGERWGVARELTQGMTKGGAAVRRIKGKTPFTLLREYTEGNRQAGALFVEFGRTFKGKRQLFWSPGLRAALGLDEEKTDQELSVEELTPHYEQVAQVNADDWRLVIAHDARGELLHIAGQFGAQGLSALLAELRARPPTHQSGGTESCRWG